jgi:hypothetical protein
MSLLPTFRNFSRPLEAVEESGSHGSAASINSSFDECSSSSKDVSPIARKHKRAVSKTSLPPSPVDISSAPLLRPFDYSINKLPLPTGSAITLDECVECTTSKQLLFEVALLDEQLLPDNGLLLRTWSSLVSW